MFNRVATALVQDFGSPPAFRVWGKARPERDWRNIGIHATHRRDAFSQWPRFLWRGTCITWTDEVIAVGWDFALQVLREQMEQPASREHPLAVPGGRLRDNVRRQAAGASTGPGSSEVLAHECGHTWQVRRMGLLYWPVVGAMTLFREGPHWWNHFENQASELGLFGGILNGSVSPELISRMSTEFNQH
jgi:hypothetical protein